MASAPAAKILAAPEVANVTTQVINQTINQSIWPSAAAWFLIGAASTLTIYLLIDYFRNKRG